MSEANAAAQASTRAIEIASKYRIGIPVSSLRICKLLAQGWPDATSAVGADSQI